MIEDNHIGRNTRNFFVRTLTDIMVWMVDNMPGKLVDRESLKRTNTRDMGLLNNTKRKQRNILKANCKLLLHKMNSAAKNPPIKLEGDRF